MNWTGKDMDTYLQQKEYIDTLVIPLIKVESTLERMKTSASAAEFTMLLASMIETQFKGRMMFAPPFSYTASTSIEDMEEQTLAAFKESPFKHVFFLTTDPAWVSLDENGQVIWLPSIPLENMDVQLRQTILEDQLRQVLPKFTEKWATA
ncbi:YpiF family protein [Sporosarcina sp. Te-1]|uniref:YpiF family protein n=1 Tax=Sporosarcina sp. Te-1 TaxID=2818390 RepID=UPI001A9DD1BA|nr:YpiF family protein [Sporosarcina sp. Te-1]QTD42171.1 YpiF family protein [Sporosarcina sp. Te-1]